MSKTKTNRTRRLARLGLGLALVVTTTGATGCFGRFRLVRAVYEFNAGIENKFVRSLATFAMVVIPVYGVAGLADWVVLNVIEFWSGRPVIASRALPDGGRLTVERRAPDVLVLRRTDAAGRTEEAEIVKVAEHAGQVRLPGGAVLAAVERTGDGRVISRVQAAGPRAALLTAAAPAP